jgi:hypothetical protein
MTSRLINLRDLQFVLYELLQIEALTERSRYADHSRETFDAAIDTALKIATEHFATHNRKADEHEPEFDGQRVSMIPEVKAALDAFCRSGFMAAAKDYEQGGMQLPVTVAQACLALFNAANVSTAAYPFLTIANANLIEAFGSEEQKRRYVAPLLEGRFFGTMALTEAQAGSSLSDIKTTATPTADGAALQLLMREIDRTMREVRECESPELRRYAQDLATAVDGLMETTRNLLCAAANGETDFALANASVYLEMMGHIVVAWIWLRQARIAVAGLAEAHDADRDFYQGKLQACAYFFRWELPKTRHHKELLNGMDRTCFEMQIAWF